MHTQEKMPCPHCGRLHALTNTSVPCACGHVLRAYRPLFASTAGPGGWRWGALCRSCGESMTDDEVSLCARLEMEAACSGCFGLEN